MTVPPAPGPSSRALVPTRLGWDAAVIAVVCDERAHPRTQVAGALTVVTIGTLDDLAGLLLRGVTS